MDQLMNELNELKIYNCPECNCATGDDWKYVDFSNKSLTRCPQCGVTINLTLCHESVQTINPIKNTTTLLKIFFGDEDVDFTLKEVSKQIKEGNTSGTNPRFEIELLNYNIDCETTEDFWDCECEKNFIHPKSITYCPDCGSHAEDQPDSRICEVKATGLQPIKEHPTRTIKGDPIVQCHDMPCYLKTGAVDYCVRDGDECEAVLDTIEQHGTIEGMKIVKKATGRWKPGYDLQELIHECKT